MFVVVMRALIIFGSGALTVPRTFMSINLGTPCKNGYEIFGLPPICSLSKGTYDAGRDTWDLTSGDASGLTLNCPNFCGKMEFTIIPKNDP